MRASQADDCGTPILIGLLESGATAFKFFTTPSVSSVDFLAIHAVTLSRMKSDLQGNQGLRYHRDLMCLSFAMIDICARLGNGSRRSLSSCLSCFP